MPSNDPKGPSTDPRSVDADVSKDLGPGHVTRPSTDQKPNPQRQPKEEPPAKK